MLQSAEKKQVMFRFYGTLNSLLLSKKRQNEHLLAFKGRQTVKHLIESMGIPHTEIGLIITDDQPVGFDHIPEDGERFAVYPHFKNLISDPNSRQWDSEDNLPHFLLDGHLGRLAAYLRMLGFDAAYYNHACDHQLAEWAEKERRILLTRDRGLLKRKNITEGCCLLSLDPREQLLQVCLRYKLGYLMKPFTRCMTCNEELVWVRKDDVLDELEPKTKLYFNHFKRCQSCNRLFWAGSHHKRMLTLIALLNERIADQNLSDDDY